ncbi:MAG: ArsR family transcriptional regulator [Candidatus Marinimicrobia bacterium]|nr:ArsR family transcriptional regulator [Candidatus Neomarinimicrobiota bacterium]
MLKTLITSKTRVKLLIKFFLNPGTRAYLRGLAAEFDEFTNSVRVELNRLSDAKIISSEKVGRTIEYRANSKHSLFNELRDLVQKYAGVDQLVETLIKKLGDVKTAYLVGDYAQGIDSGLVDIVLLGDINKPELDHIAERRGKDISRKIRPMVVTVKELHALWEHLNMDHALLIWGKPVKKVAS